MSDSCGFVLKFACAAFSLLQRLHWCTVGGGLGYTKGAGYVATVMQLGPITPLPQINSYVQRPSLLSVPFYIFTLVFVSLGLFPSLYILSSLLSAARDKRYCIMEVPAACVPDNAKVSSLTHVKDPLNLCSIHGRLVD